MVKRQALMVLLILGAMSGCTSIQVDEYRTQENLAITADETVVVLGRRHSSNYETEPDLISCIGSVLESGGSINVLKEQAFVDALYPWLEPRIAPIRVKDMNRILKHEQVMNAFKARKVRYMVWVDGKTETTDSGGSIGCSISPTGGGCFGFGTWEKESDYVAKLWDFEKLENMGEISADASGTSYMPAVVVPIPIIARVQNTACKGIGKQLQSFLTPSET